MFCNHCPTRANCVYFKKNSFCEIDQMINEDISGFRNACNDKWYFLINLIRTEDKNRAEFYNQIQKEATETFEEINRLKEEGDDENAGLQESKSVAVEP